MKVSQPVSINGNRQRMSKEPDPQVVPKAERRRFSAEYKLRILAEADECTERGAIGALLRTRGSLLIPSGQVAQAARTQRTGRASRPETGT